VIYGGKGRRDCRDIENNNEEFKKVYFEHIKLEQDLEALYSLKYFPLRWKRK